MKCHNFHLILSTTFLITTNAAPVGRYYTCASVESKGEIALGTRDGLSVNSPAILDDGEPSTELATVRLKERQYGSGERINVPGIGGASAGGNPTGGGGGGGGTNGIGGVGGGLSSTGSGVGINIPGVGGGGGGGGGGSPSGGGGGGGINGVGGGGGGGDSQVGGGGGGIGPIGGGGGGSSDGNSSAEAYGGR